jgi:tetratricopeptide (TPR) repeat protein
VALIHYDSPSLQVCDLRSGALLYSEPFPSRASAGAWSPDGRTLAVGEGDTDRVHLYTFDPATAGLRPACTLQAQATGNGGMAVRFNAAGDRLVARGWNGKVHLFDVNTGRLLFSTPSLPCIHETVIELDPTGRRLAATRVGPRGERIGTTWSVADAREYRVMEDNAHRTSECGIPAVHPNGRLAAHGLNGGVALFDLETGRELAFLEQPGDFGHVSFDGAGNLYTNFFTGAFRWPVRPDPTRPGRLLLGPPERLPFPSGNRHIAANEEGTVIAQTKWHGSSWVLPANAAQPRRLEGGGGNWVSVSPDGRWVAFQAPQAYGAKVCMQEAATGRLVWQSSGEGWGYCRFSRDGRWLVTDDDGGRAYRVGTWEPGPELGLGTPWDVSPDGRLVVVGQTDGIYRLVELETGREVARLDDPEQIAGPAVFTPDGSRLVVGTLDGLRVWELRRMGAELAKLGLDWNTPPCPPAEAATGELSHTALEVRVDLGELEDDAVLGDPSSRGDQCNVLVAGSLLLAFDPLDWKAYRRRGRAEGALAPGRAAIADYTAALGLMAADDPGRVDLLRRRAGNHLVLQEYDRALADIRRAEQLDPACGPGIRATHASFLDRLAGERPERAAALADVRTALELVPDFAAAHNRLAGLLATGPAGQRDPAEALRHAQRAVELAGEEPMFLNILGAALYRNDRAGEAVPALEKSLAASNGRWDGDSLYFLALCHAKLGDAQKARECYDRGVAWQQQAKLDPRGVLDVEALRVEAEALLK